MYLFTNIYLGDIQWTIYFFKRELQEQVNTASTYYRYTVLKCKYIK